MILPPRGRERDTMSNSETYTTTLLKSHARKLGVSHFELGNLYAKVMICGDFLYSKEFIFDLIYCLEFRATWQDQEIISIEMIAESEQSRLSLSISEIREHLNK